jgi:hypothetical protein
VRASRWRVLQSQPQAGGSKDLSPTSSFGSLLIIRRAGGPYAAVGERDHAPAVTLISDGDAPGIEDDFLLFKFP